MADARRGAGPVRLPRLRGGGPRRTADPACPTCGARRLTFQEILATYFLEPLAVEPLLDTLRGTPGEVERMSTSRSWRMLEADESFLASVASPVADAGATTLADPIAEFRAGRARTMDRVADLTPAEWERTGVHPGWGRVTVRQQIGYLARHEQSHLAALEASCRAAGSQHS